MMRWRIKESRASCIKRRRSKKYEIGSGEAEKRRGEEERWKETEEEK
jgi:hypothetical protein